MKPIVKDYEIGEVFLRIDTESHKLIRTIAYEDNANLTIPSIMPDGTIIKSISHDAFERNGTMKWGAIEVGQGIKLMPGSFESMDADLIILPKGITEIPNNCFAYSSIKRIDNMEQVETIGRSAFMFFINGKKPFQWPLLAAKIPYGCFYNSDISELRGIENVTEIGDSAFKFSGIKTFEWPAGAKRIPEGCFEGSQLESITGTESLECIDRAAFAGTYIKEFTWPKSVGTIPNFCFCKTLLQRIYGLDDVTSIGSWAFADSQLKKLDLLSSEIVMIGKRAFEGLEKDCVVKPYYMSEEEYENCF